MSGRLAEVSAMREHRKKRTYAAGSGAA